jgi:anti-anti-sigma factor
MTLETAFHYEIEKSEDPTTGRVTTIKLQGKLNGEGAGQIKELVKPIIASGGRIVMDFADLSYLDSAGLGTLVSLKVSAIHQGYCTLELVHLSPRIRELMSLTNLLDLFSK